jgi:hypothetical protein
MDDLVFIAIFGYILQFLEDYDLKELRLHPFYLTRQTYVMMTVYLILDMMNVSFQFCDLWLKTFAPLSIAISLSYLGLGRSWKEMDVAGSTFGHIVMPLMSLSLLLQSSQTRNWTPILLMIGYYAIHYTGQWVYYHWKKQLVYPECDIHTLKGNLKNLATPAAGLVISLLHMFIDLSNPWYYYISSLVIVITWTVRAVMKIRELKKNEV